MSSRLCAICFLIGSLALGAAPSVETQLAELVRQRLGDRARVSIRFPKSGEIPRGAKLHLESSGAPLGVVRVRAEWTEGGRTKSLRTQTSVSASLPVAVAARPIPHGTPITPRDVTFVERPLTPLALTGYFDRWERLEGLRAENYVRAGDVLSAANTRQPYAITRGQRAELGVREGGLSIRAEVEAMENGNAGDWIRVRNPATQRTLQARVLGEGKVSLQ